MESWRLLLTLSLYAYFSASYAQPENSTQPEFAIPQGRLQGVTMVTRKGRTIAGFLKIPYGQPPAENLRFANPVAANSWNGVLDASRKASQCPQPGLNGIVGEEDCLYVKVFTPQNSSTSLLPVMVYIHGGAYMTESPADYSPEYLLDVDVVLVTLNYRLGVLGFLSTGDGVASGNWGLKDQVLALKWVQDNVKYFGGDPDRVTLVGESAGAVSVHLLTLSNSTIGLFHKYITQSGSALAPWSHRPRAAYSIRAFKFGDSVGCPNDTSNSLISCLRRFDFSDIIVNAAKFAKDQYISDMPWGPTDELDIEGAVLTDSPSNLFAAGKVRDLPWISGVVRDEGLLKTTGFCVDEEKLRDFLDRIDTLLPISADWMYESDFGAARTSASKSFYFNNHLTSDTSVLFTNLTRLIGDALFYYPAYKALKLHHAVAVNPQYFYTFNYRGTYSSTSKMTGSLLNCGVRHTDDLIYFSPKDSSFSEFNETMSDTDYQMVDTLVQLWTYFIIDGKPRAAALGDGIKWEPYSAEDKYLQIGNGSDVALEVQRFFFPERMQFWADLDAAMTTA